LETVWRFLKKLKLELAYGPATPLLGIFPKNVNSLLLKIAAFAFHCSIIQNSQDMETSRCLSVNEWIKVFLLV
jgi:hypothetical protein